MEQRSHDGCWTCRLRKKKCDEKTPVCTSCSSLDLTCHRSAHKPSWMDGGERERAERERVKTAVAKIVSERRASRGRCHQNKDKPQQQKHQQQQQPPPQQHQQQQQQFSDLEHRLHDILGDQSAATTEWALDNFTLSDGSNLVANALMTPESNPLDAMSLSSFSSFANNFSNNFPNGILPLDTPLSTFSTENSNGVSLLEPSLPSMSLQDATLLIHYFEKTFYWQFRFLFPGGNMTGGDKAWLVWLMANSRSAYLAALASSASHMNISNREDVRRSIADAAGLGLRYSSAVKDLLHQSLQCYEEQSPLFQSVGDAIRILGGITILLRLNVLQGAYRDWGYHLNAATCMMSRQLGDGWSVTSSLLRSLRKNDSPCMNSHEDPAAGANNSCGAAKNGDNAAALQETAGTWIVNSIMWFDILSCLTMPCMPRLYDHYVEILRSERPDVPVENLPICENWVLLSILQIHKIRVWKRQARTEGSLSVWTLTNQASPIRHCLETGIARTSQWLSHQKDGDSLEPCDYTRKVTTYIFAYSALVLLETIVSGAHPSLPEIRQGVCHSMAAFELLPDPDYLHALSWPLCVTGCLAEPHQYGFFTGMISSVSGPNIGNLLNVKQILERCWSLRELGEPQPDGVTWEDAMASLGQNILLI